MSYPEKREKLNKIKEKETAARDEVLALRNRQSSIKDEISQAYDKLIQIKAEHQAGEHTNDDIERAQNKYESLKNEQASLSEKIKVAERVAENLKSKVNHAQVEFNLSKTPYYEKELQPYFEDLKTALEDAQEAIDNINSFQRMLQRDQVNKKALLRGITWKSMPVIRKDNRGGSLEMKNFITSNNIDL